VLIHCHCAVNIAIICSLILIKIFTKPNLTDIGFQIVTRLLFGITAERVDNLLGYAIVICCRLLQAY